MRVSRKAMQRHHDEIVDAASRLLRQCGIGGTSVADLMQAAGATHGGFYRHFASKDELVAEAASAAFTEIVQRLQSYAEREGPPAALLRYVREYLSEEHLENPGIGCPIATYGAEVARSGDVIQKAFARGFDAQLAWIAEALSGPAKQRAERAAEIMATLVGAVVAARVASSSNAARSILTSAKKRALLLIVPVS